MRYRIGLIFCCFSAAALVGCRSLSGRIEAQEREIAALRREVDALRGGRVPLAEVFEKHVDRYKWFSRELISLYLRQLELPADPGPEEVAVYFDRIFGLRRFPDSWQLEGEIEAKILAAGRRESPEYLRYLAYRPFIVPYLSALEFPAGGRESIGPYLGRLYRYRPGGPGRLHDTLVGKIGEIGPENVGELVPYLDNPAFAEVFATFGGWTREAFVPEIQRLRRAGKLKLPVCETPVDDMVWAALNKGMAAENRVELAIFFAKNGSLKAFQYLGDEYLKSRNRSSLRKFLMLSPCRVDEFPDWYRRNRDELVFDPARRCFLIPGNDP
ncbi:hypothetical protein [Victivallis lenta]|uniref:hypothetical protein n=1 Tax=Victivallis lenta TaxID=2606640 RepID=UPI002583233E|nr:hypothetical protein [uncultured Victivallis sp.]MBS5529638.1 hypothetical protein [bacterium]